MQRLELRPVLDYRVAHVCTLINQGMPHCDSWRRIW
jgi:hypothetical protein